MKPLSALLLLLLAACSHTPETAATPAAPHTESCSKRMCTREYEPVCATIEQNGRTVQQTFGNRCSVCSDTGRIVKLAQGACGGVR